MKKTKIDKKEFIHKKKKYPCLEARYLKKTKLKKNVALFPQLSFLIYHIAQFSQSVQDLKSMSPMRNVQDVSVARMRPACRPRSQKPAGVQNSLSY